MAEEYTYTLNPDGSLVDRATGMASAIARIDTHLVSVDHLVPHVDSFILPKGDKIRVLVRYSCHCWTKAYEFSDGGRRVFTDHKQLRVFDPDRFLRSMTLGEMVKNLQSHKCMMTPAKRNFMAYNASLKLDDGSFYKMFFKVEKSRGSVFNIRYSIILTVESAYCTPDEDEGMNVKFNAIIDSVLTERPLKYKP